MVTEAIPDVSLEAPSTPVADAELTPAPDAAPPPEVDAAESDVDTFLAGRKEGTSAQSPEGTTAEELPELVEAREAAAKAAAEKATADTTARIEREAAAQRAQAARQAEETQFRQNYQARMQEAAQDAYEAAIDRGMSEAEAQQAGQRAAQRFNSHHADGLKLYGSEARMQAIAESTTAFNNAVAEVLGRDSDAFFKDGDQPKRYTSHSDAIKSLMEVARKGYVPASEAEASTKAAILAYRRDLEKKGLISGSQSGTQVQGSAPGRQFGSEHDLNVAFNSGQVDREAYAREYKRLTGKEP